MRHQKLASYSHDAVSWLYRLPNRTSANAKTFYAVARWVRSPSHIATLYSIFSFSFVFRSTRIGGHGSL